MATSALHQPRNGFHKLVLPLRFELIPIYPKFEERLFIQNILGSYGEQILHLGCFCDPYVSVGFDVVKLERQ